MLAIARILRTGAKFRCSTTDEGLRTVIVQQIGRHHQGAKDEGFPQSSGGAELPFCGLCAAGIRCGSGKGVNDPQRSNLEGKTPRSFTIILACREK